MFMFKENYPGLQPFDVNNRTANEGLLYLQAKCKAVPLGVNKLTSIEGHFSNNLTTFF